MDVVFCSSECCCCNHLSFRSEKVADAIPCDGYSECQMEFNSTLVPYHTNDTCSVQEFASCQEKCLDLIMN